MATIQPESLGITSSEDVVHVRQATRSMAVALGFGLVEQTKLITAASELARNALTHGGGGSVTLEPIQGPGRVGLRLTFEDRGPGIPDVAEAMRDGFTTGNGLGLGLGGSRRLVNEFALETSLGQGTKVTVAMWR
ncbi:MAG TPA: anti-sigma regulatory factor [Armatimonadota bacterium]